MSKKDTSTVVATRQVVIILFQTLLDADNTAMLPKYTGTREEDEKEAI